MSGTKLYIHSQLGGLDIKIKWDEVWNEPKHSSTKINKKTQSYISKSYTHTLNQGGPPPKFGKKS